jgi:hypothetical protein
MQTPALPDQPETNEADSADTGDREVVTAYTTKHLNEREAKWYTTEKKNVLILLYSRDRSSDLIYMDDLLLFLIITVHWNGCDE